MAAVAAAADGSRAVRTPSARRFQAQTGAGTAELVAVCRSARKDESAHTRRTRRTRSRCRRINSVHTVYCYVTLRVPRLPVAILKLCTSVQCARRGRHWCAAAPHEDGQQPQLGGLSSNPFIHDTAAFYPYRPICLCPGTRSQQSLLPLFSRQSPAYSVHNRLILLFSSCCYRVPSTPCLAVVAPAASRAAAIGGAPRELQAWARGWRSAAESVMLKKRM